MRQGVQVTTNLFYQVRFVRRGSQLLCHVVHGRCKVGLELDRMNLDGPDVVQKSALLELSSDSDRIEHDADKGTFNNTILP
jgi:hypothetical protein